MNCGWIRLQALNSFLDAAEAEVRPLISLYAEVVSPCCNLSPSLFFFFFTIDLHSVILQGRNADSLAQYFGEDPARCPFEQGMLQNLSYSIV
jgi:hypothetical protein